MSPFRQRALALLALVVPSDWGSAAFASIVDGHYSPGFGTTCAYLIAWLLWALGCRDAAIVNRDDAASGLRYRVGEGVSRVVNGAKALGAWRDGCAGIKPGDPFFLSLGPAITEHLAVFVARGSRGGVSAWRSADAGQRRTALADVTVDPEADGFLDAFDGEALAGETASDQCARYVVRDFDGSRLRTVNGWKPIVGYVDLDALPFAAPAMGDPDGPPWAFLLFLALGLAAFAARWRR